MAEIKKKQLEKIKNVAERKKCVAEISNLRVKKQQFSWQKLKFCVAKIPKKTWQKSKKNVAKIKNCVAEIKKMRDRNE